MLWSSLCKFIVCSMVKTVFFPCIKPVICSSLHVAFIHCYHLPELHGIEFCRDWFAGEFLYVAVHRVFLFRAER